MEIQQDRRSFMAGAATSAAGITAALAAGTATTAAAADGHLDLECMTILYENGDGVYFDFDYYATRQMPLILEKYGSSIAGFELRRGQPGANNAPPRYIATVSIWIADGKAFDDAAAKHQAAIAADVAKFTNANLFAQRDRVVAVAGADGKVNVTGA
ncbi:MAG: EthD family reductase [Gammaproteobacteria bacterium]|nr:EthD family reductase [Gammaproteobacteria bacterium]